MFLRHSSTVGDALAQSFEQSEINQDDALLLMRATAVLRRHILVKQNHFMGSFPSDCLTGPVLNHCCPSCWCCSRVRRQTSKIQAGRVITMLLCTSDLKWQVFSPSLSFTTLSSMPLFLTLPPISAISRIMRHLFHCTSI